MSTGQDSPHPASPWLDWPLGSRVVVRRRLAEGGYSDVLGELVYRSVEAVEVLHHGGTERIEAADIAVGKIVPPPPERRAFRERP
ncbi:MAG TPA: hypothetical protein VKZ73_03555 [Microbacterium sp.]|nr:hypothetical protein [Microbacterium sp.]